MARKIKQRYCKICEDEVAKGFLYCVDCGLVRKSLTDKRKNLIRRIKASENKILRLEGVVTECKESLKDINYILTGKGMDTEETINFDFDWALPTDEKETTPE